MLRFAAFMAVVHPPDPAFLKGLRCPKGGGETFKAFPVAGREGDALSVAVRLLPACYPEGSMHTLVEYALSKHGEEIIWLLTRADHADREALFERVLSASIYDLRPTLAADYGNDG